MSSSDNSFDVLPAAAKNLPDETIIRIFYFVPNLMVFYRAATCVSKRWRIMFGAEENDSDAAVVVGDRHFKERFINQFCRYKISLDYDKDLMKHKRKVEQLTGAALDAKIETEAPFPAKWNWKRRIETMILTNPLGKCAYCRYKIGPFEYGLLVPTTFRMRMCTRCRATQLIDFPTAIYRYFRLSAYETNDPTLQKHTKMLYDTHGSSVILREIAQEWWESKHGGSAEAAEAELARRRDEADKKSLSYIKSFKSAPSELRSMVYQTVEELLAAGVEKNAGKDIDEHEGCMPPTPLTPYEISKVVQYTYFYLHGKLFDFMRYNDEGKKKLVERYAKAVLLSKRRLAISEYKLKELFGDDLWNSIYSRLRGKLATNLHFDIDSKEVHKAPCAITIAENLLIVAVKTVLDEKRQEIIEGIFEKELFAKKDVDSTKLLPPVSRREALLAIGRVCEKHYMSAPKIISDSSYFFVKQYKKYAAEKPVTFGLKLAAVEADCKTSLESLSHIFEREKYLYEELKRCGIDGYFDIPIAYVKNYILQKDEKGTDATFFQIVREAYKHIKQTIKNNKVSFRDGYLDNEKKEAVFKKVVKQLTEPSSPSELPSSTAAAEKHARLKKMLVSYSIGNSSMPFEMCLNILEKLVLHSSVPSDEDEDAEMADAAAGNETVPVASARGKKRVRSSEKSNLQDEEEGDEDAVEEAKPKKQAKKTTRSRL